jgi:HD-GYP domain-containing protein (c-di-GMP phosphodiesterase class II)
MTVQLARVMGIDEATISHYRRGALLHDVGKLGIPDSILHKQGSLTEEEQIILRRHPDYAFQWLSRIEYLRPALDIPYCHHEKWNGSGYPHGLKGKEIPLAARLFAVIDVWDALLSERPYKRAWSVEKAVEYLKSQKNIHFDPDFVDVFLDHFVYQPGRDLKDGNHLRYQSHHTYCG